MNKRELPFLGFREDEGAGASHKLRAGVGHQLRGRRPRLQAALRVPLSTLRVPSTSGSQQSASCAPGISAVMYCLLYERNRRANETRCRYSDFRYPLFDFRYPLFDFRYPWFDFRYPWVRFSVRRCTVRIGWPARQWRTEVARCEYSEYCMCVLVNRQSPVAGAEPTFPGRQAPEVSAGSFRRKLPRSFGKVRRSQAPRQGVRGGDVRDGHDARARRGCAPHRTAVPRREYSRTPLQPAVSTLVPLSCPP
jgi:hypothetical protein